MEFLWSYLAFTETSVKAVWGHLIAMGLLAIVWHYFIQAFVYRMNGGGEALYKGYIETFQFSLPFYDHYRQKAAKDFFFCGRESYEDSGIVCHLVGNHGSWSTLEYIEILKQNDTKQLRQIAREYHFGIDFFIVTPIVAVVLAYATPLFIFVLPFAVLATGVSALIDYTFKLGPFKPRP